VDLDRLMIDLPAVRERFVKIPLQTYPYLADQLEFLCFFVEEQVVRRSHDLAEEPAGEAAFVLLYYQWSTDLIPDSIPFGTITVLHIVLGELAPKSIAIRKALPTTLWVSAPRRLFYLVFKPAIWLLNGLANWLLKSIFHLEPVSEKELAHSEEELRLILDESAKAAQISRVSQEIVANAFEVRRRLVREVMTPRSEVVYLDIDAPTSRAGESADR
jgi:CBS domain containing-hemolysin-like protein